MYLPWKRWAPRVAMVGLASCSFHVSDGTRTQTEDPSEVPRPVMLAFEEEATLQLVPGELHTVWVSGQPPAPYEVSFTLLGDAAGAWVDRTTVVADENGRASVQLQASKLGSTFRLRAAMEDGPAAELGVSVSAEGFGTLRIIPVYQGTRLAKEWTASVVARATCEESATAAPEAPEGALVAHSGPDEPVVVDGAPVGPSLTVALHSGRIMWGCTVVRELLAGSSRDVRVAVKDLPINLAATSLNTKLTIASADGLDAMLEAATDQLVDAFLPAGAEAEALLDAMQSAAPQDEAPAFAARRIEAGWDAAAQAHLAALPTPLRNRCRGWAHTGLAAAPLTTIDGELSGVSDMPGRARFEVSWLGSVTAENAGIPPGRLMSWTADPGDVLRLAGDLPWVPSRYIGDAAGLGAAAEMAVDSVPAALAAAADCPRLGEVLAGYSGCTGDCMAMLCVAGLKSRWRAGLEASKTAGMTGEIVVNASGRARVNSAAAPIDWTGDWLGTIRYGDGAEASVEGQVDAASTDVIAN
ncbi:hypothetical protein WME89_17595 [Sorangium sp. So ce321]|uniref:hypothetical protein n=1 Tax=Sorangium sp. So ce321 TaxID=3133300 RepID=UPI003F5F28C9